MATDDWTFFFSGHNYVKIEFGGNITIKKNIQSSGRLCFSAGSNYNRKKLRPEKKMYSHLAISWKLIKNYVRKKGTVISSRWLEGKTQNTPHIIDTKANKMSRVTLPSSGFAPSLSMGGAVAPPNHGAAAPQRHAQAATHRGCTCFCWFARLGKQNKRQQIIERGGVSWL